MQAQLGVIGFPLWWRWATYVQHVEYLLFAFQAWIKMVHFPILEFAWNSRGWIVLVLFWVDHNAVEVFVVHILPLHSNRNSYFLHACIFWKSRVFLNGEDVPYFYESFGQKKRMNLWLWKCEHGRIFGFGDTKRVIVLETSWETIDKKWQMCSRNNLNISFF